MLLHMLACLATKGSQTSSKPNILFMVIDDLGSNDLGWSQIMHGFRYMLNSDNLSTSIYFKQPLS